MAETYTQQFQAGGPVDEIQDQGLLERLQDFFTDQMVRHGEREMFNAQAQLELAKQITPSAGQVANFGGMLLPGAGYIDAEGSWPSLPSYEQPFSEAFSGEPYPSMAENLQRGGFGGYFDASMQGLGLAGDALYAAPLVGPLLGATVGTGLKTASAVGKAVRATSRGGRGITSLDETQQMLRAAVNQFARDDSGFISPTIQALIERAPPNLKGQQITEWARANTNKGVKPQELEFLGLDEFVSANPNATTREAVEGISGNKVTVSKNIRGGGEEILEFERTVPETNPLGGSDDLWDFQREVVRENLFPTGGSRRKLKKFLDYYNNNNADAQVKSVDGIPDNLIEDAINDFAKHQYFTQNPYEMLRPKGEQFGSGTFAFGNEEGGYSLFINNKRLTDPYFPDPNHPNHNVHVGSSTEARLELRDRLRDEGHGTFSIEGFLDDPDFLVGTEYKTFVDESLPGGSNYREVVFNWEDAPVTHNIGHFDDETQIAHALIRDRKLADGTDSLHIDELQSDLHTMGSQEGYQLPERLRIEEVNKIEEFLEGTGLTMKPPESLQTDRLVDNVIFVRDGDEFLGTVPLSDIEAIANNLFYGTAPSQSKVSGVVRNAFGESLGVSGGITSSEKLNELVDLVKPLAESGPVPYYPYKDNWHEMVIKNMLLQAVEEGKPALSISGSQAIKSRYTDEYSKFYELLYDRKVPSAMKRLANRYGGEFEQGILDVQDTFNNWEGVGTISHQSTIGSDVRAANIIRITPEMRARILEEGIQSFGGGGTVHSGIANLKRTHANKYNDGGIQYIQQFQYGGSVEDIDIFSPDERMQGIERNSRKKPPYPEGEDPTAYRWTGEEWVKKSQTGFLGPRIHEPTGATMTEYSIGNIDNPLDPDDPLRPSMVSTLTEEEIGFLTTLPEGVSPREWGKHPLGRSILEKSWDHYKMRVGQGLSPFLTHDEESPQHAVQQFQYGGPVDGIDIFADGGFVGDRPHPREHDFPVGGPAWKAREAARVDDIDVFDYLPSAGQAVNFGGMLLPGAGYLDYFGEYATLPSGDQPFSEAFSGEHYPSFVENVQRGGFGGYFDAGMQGLGVAGDTMYALPLIGAVTGPTIGTGLKAVGAAGKLIKRGIGALSRGADEGIARLDVPTPSRSGAEATPIPETFDQSEIFSLDPVGTSAIAQRNADDLGRVNFPEHVPAPRELIKPTTKGKGGRIPGAPAHVKTPADEQRIIDNYLNEAELGAAGAFWYSNTARRIDLDVGNVLGARPGAADRAAAVIGEFSPRATLEANRLAQVRAFNQHATGLPVEAGMAPRNKAAQGILDTGEFSAQSALKVGPFSMQVRGLSVPRGVHDVRDIKSWGYGDVQATGEANHRWMDKMQDQAVKLANERKLAGRSDWTHEQLQASRWVKHKADDMGVDIAALTDDFGPADQWLAANIFSEASPSQELINAGVLSADDMRIYTAMHQNLFTNPSGQDVLAHQLGLLSPDSTRFVGEWDGAFNPNIVTRIMADPAKGADVISGWSQEAIAFHGGLRGLLGGQADVATSFLRKPKLVGNTNAYRIPFDRVVTEADIASYKNAAQKSLREADVPGDVVVNFRNDKELELTWLIFDETDKVQKKAFRNAIEGITGGRGIPAINSGRLLTYEDRFKPSAWMEKLQNPLMRSNVEDMLPRIAADIERDIAKLPLTDTGQEIYQRTIIFIKEGGLAAVENAVKQGILPAAVIGALLLGANQVPQLPFSSQDLGQPRT